MNDQSIHADVMTAPTAPLSSTTHGVGNMPFDLPDYDAYESDAVLKGIVGRAGAQWVEADLSALGRRIGSAELTELARLANTHKPVLHTHDRFGRRLDRVEYHPAYHELMRLAYQSRVHSLPWTETGEGRQVARAAISYLWNQAENGINCPNTMSYSIPPLLRANPSAGAAWEAGVLSSHYDPRHIPARQKRGLTVAMSMTEKQGGSDIRLNETQAEPTGVPGEYVLRGHKFFCSAPMGDVYLFTARTKSGVSLFLAPRLLPDGRHNRVFIQRLKEKVGNWSNASSEIEIDGALAYILGEEGHGIREFIKHMTHYIRLDLSIASVGIMRRAVTLAYQHVRNRRAFGSPIADLPQMRNALADMALEWEAALLLSMRMAGAYDEENKSEHEKLLLRVGVPIAKYWNCRRTNQVVVEAVECHGGMGYVEEQPIARVLREAPLNSIWEGTSAMMGLDFIRAVRHNSGIRDVLLGEIREGSSGNNVLRRFADDFANDLDRTNNDMEPHARRLLGKAALGLQASLMVRHAPSDIADLFVASRIQGGSSELGTLPAEGAILARICERALPN
ncbi:MAG: acyl-CoA dehydrogenase family protein [Rhizobiales bacterium]|nr:acyl-CoA dehydrogenase family protein [Hyphomicrobiales bacterium]